MKKIWLVITLLHLPVLGMESDQSKFDLGQFLKEHKWHERKDALTKDQREEFGEYLEEQQKERTSTNLADIDLATILMDGLTLVEKKKSPATLQRILYQGILQGSAKKIRRAIRQGHHVNNAIVYTDYSRVPCKFRPQVVSGSKTPLDWAVRLARPSAVLVLLEEGAHSNQNLLYHSTYSGDMKSARLLLINGSGYKYEENNNATTDIMDSALDSYPGDPESCSEFIQELFNHGYKFSAQNYRVNPWRNAIHNDQGRSVLDRRLVKLFVKNGGKLNQTITCSGGNLTPLALAMQNGHLTATEALLDEGADITVSFTEHPPRKSYNAISYAQMLVNKQLPNSKQIQKVVMRYKK